MLGRTFGVTFAIVSLNQACADLNAPVKTFPLVFSNVESFKLCLKISQKFGNDCFLLLLLDRP
jgi:hypothetical protein